MAYRAPQIGDMKHYLTMCSMRDVVMDDGNMSLKRDGIYRGWAEIRPIRSSFMGVSGYAIQEPKNSRSHVIAMRFRTDIDISSAAWLYEQRRLSGDRWFKVIGEVGFSECSLFFLFDVTLVERGDMVTPPSVPEKVHPEFNGMPLPDGVKL